MTNITHNIDVLDGLRSLDDNSIDTIITSPPYNKKGLAGGKIKTGNQIWGKFNIDYDVYSDDMDEQDYQNWQIDILNECHRVLKPGGSMFYNHKNRRYKCKEYTPHEWIVKSDINLFQTIIWNRNNSPSINNTHLMPVYEYIFWMTKTQKTPKIYRDRLDTIKDIWNISPSRNKKHPATFPEKLVENCSLLTTNEGDTILDIFSGIGTTSKVCKKLNRNFIGFEISNEYISNQI
jgi:site-specific DNA-methyltransferase (adenine-specific)